MNKKMILVLVAVLSLIMSGCLGGGGNDGGSGSVTTGLVGSESPVQVHEIAKMMENSGIVLNGDEEKYYEQLEKVINEKIGVPADGPNRAIAASTPVLSKLTLNMVSYEIQLSPVEKTTFNIGEKVTVTASYTGTGSVPNDVSQSPNLKWAIYNGAGSLSGKVFTPVAAAGTTVFIVYYMENKVTRYALFRLKIIALSQLLLSKVSDHIVGSSVEVSTYDLSKIAVTAKYSNGALNDVTGNNDLKWTLASGRGTMQGNIYTAPQLAETATFKAAYTEAGVARSASFRLVVTKPVFPAFTINLSKSIDAIQTGSVYDLSQIIVKADYSTGTSAEVTSSPNLTWVKSAGRGILTGRSYASASVAETAVFTAIYKEYGATKTAQFKLSVIVPGLPSKLVIVTQPSNPASAGTVFAQQPVIKLQNALNNDVKIAGVSVTAVKKTGTGSLLGTLTVKTDADGVAKFSGLSCNLTGIITVGFTSGSIPAVESAQITVESPASFESPASDFIYGGDPVTITGYVGKGGQVVIPASIKAKVIGPGAFANKTSITKFTISNGVTSIGTCSFIGCTGLTNVTIPASVTSIGNDAFQSCSDLTNVTILAGTTNAGNGEYVYCRGGLKSIGDRAFCYCRSLTNITIPYSVTSIGYCAFAYCLAMTAITVDRENQKYSSDVNGVLYDKNKTTIIQCPAKKSGTFTIPESVTNIGEHSFVWCVGLTNVIIPCGLKSIGNFAFWYCYNLINIKIPASVTSIGHMAFYDCNEMTAITVDCANPNYSSDAGGVLYNKNKTVIIRCPGRKTGAFTIPESVTSIEDHAFTLCRYLTSVTIPNSITSIRAYSFMNVGIRGAVVIPASVTSISSEAFGGCVNMTSVYFEGNAPEVTGMKLFKTFPGSLKIYYHATNSGWSPKPSWNTFTTLTY